jgi:hypothetical protein
LTCPHASANTNANQDSSRCIGVALLALDTDKPEERSYVRLAGAIASQLVEAGDVRGLVRAGQTN